MPSFMVKTLNPALPDTCFDEFNITSLKTYVDRDREEKLFSLVWAIKCYFFMMNQYRPACRNFSSQHGRSVWQKILFPFCCSLSYTEAYRMTSDTIYIAVKAGVHKARRIGASMLFQKNFAVQQVTRAGTWASQTTFISFYLRIHSP